MDIAPKPAGIYTCLIETPLGVVSACAENDALTRLWLNGQKYSPTMKDSWIDNSNYSVFEKLRAWLNAYFSGKDPTIDMKLEPKGTPFQKAVWNTLLRIPFGQVTSYGEIGYKVAAARGLRRMSAQAVGQAVGHNPIAIVIPCHRVVGADRSLVGYGGGLDIKRALLKVENIDLATAKFSRLD